MERTPQGDGVDRERLEFLARTAGNHQGLGVSLAGLLLALYGTAHLLSHEPSKVGVPHLLVGVLLAIFVIPRLFAHFYYRRKYGYVKPVSPNPSWMMVWLSTGAFALFIFLMFTVSDYTRLHKSAFAFEPFTLFLGIVFLAISLSAIRRPRYYRPYEMLIDACALLTISFLPVLHLQTKEQVFNGWFWIVLGIGSIITGLRTHRVFVRNLTPKESGHDDAESARPN